MKSALLFVIASLISATSFAEEVKVVRRESAWVDYAASYGADPCLIASAEALKKCGYFGKVVTAQRGSGRCSLVMDCYAVVQPKPQAK